MDLREIEIVEHVDGAVLAEQHAQRLACARQRRVAGGQLRLVGGHLLRGPHVVHPVADAAHQAGVRVVVVGAVRGQRARVDVELAFLCDDRQISARRQEPHGPAHVLVAGPGGHQVGPGLRPFHPGGRRDERHVQGKVRRFLVLRGEELGRAGDGRWRILREIVGRGLQNPIAVKPRIRSVSDQARHGRGARLAEQSLGAIDLGQGHQRGHVARQSPVAPPRSS